MLFCGFGGSKSRIDEGGCGAIWSDERSKIARRCGVKHILKSKCWKHLNIRALSDDAMLKKCTPLWREAHVEVKMLKAPRVWSTVVRWDVHKVHISKSKLANKASDPERFWEVEMSKKCTPLWREAHFEVKSVKFWRSRTTFGRWDVEKAHGAGARSTCGSQNGKRTPHSHHFWKLRCGKSAHRCGTTHILKSSEKHLRFGAFLDVELSEHWINRK